MRYTIPSWMKAVLEEILPGEQVAILLRHSVREKIPERPLEAFHLPITSEGIQLARELGKLLRGKLSRLYSSPVLRCLQTAGAVAAGANVLLPIQKDLFLGHHGIHILDLPKLLALQKEGKTITSYQWLSPLLQNTPWEGLMPLPFGGTAFLAHLYKKSSPQGISLFCSHDSVISFLLLYVFQDLFLEKMTPPKFLEGVICLFTREKAKIFYRDWQKEISLPSLNLSEESVRLWGHWLANTVLSGEKARYTIAGGAFKFLLTGDFSTDIDIWPYSSQDREKICKALYQNGAIPLGANSPFFETFDYHGWIVEVSLQEKGSVEDVISHFDLPLASIGVEYIPEQDQWKSWIHPLAKRDLQDRQVRLFSPFPNSDYLLTSLERQERYAKELGFQKCLESEKKAWEFFCSRPPSKRQQMVELYLLTSRDFSLLPKIQQVLGNIAWQ